MINDRVQPNFFMVFFRGHKRAIKEAIIMPWQNPLKTVLTIVTLAICFYIPLFLWTLWLNYDELEQKWQEQSSIVLFVNNKIDLKETGILLQEIKEDAIVKQALLKSAAEIKQQLGQDEQFSKIIDLITAQELPTQISVQLKVDADLEKVEQFISNFSINPQIEYISYDQKWLQQLAALTSTLLQMARVSGIMFLLIVMVILANTIGNEIIAHKSEIKLLELIGATSAQVHRRFLYMGMIFALFASAVALGFLAISLSWFQESISQLLNNFGAEISIHSLSFIQVLIVMLVVITATWIATRISLLTQSTASY